MFCSSLGSDPVKLFPYELMMEHFQKFGKYGLIMASTLLPTITADCGREMNFSDESPEPDHISNKQMQSNLKNHPLVSNSSLMRFNERIRDVAADMVRLGYV